MIKNTPDSSQLRAAAERLEKYAESLTAAAQGIRADSDLLFGGFGMGQAAANMKCMMKQTADDLNEKSRMLSEMKEALENTLHLLDEAEEADAAARL